MKYDIERDLYELTSMALALEGYIKGDDIYATVDGMFNDLPPMTLGTFLLRLRRVSALQTELDEEGRSQLAIAIQTRDHVLHDWQEHYWKRLRDEIQSRLASIQRFIDDLNNNPDDTVAGFMPELYARTIVEELINQARDQYDFDGKMVAEVNRLDDALRAITHESYFRWDGQLREVYPADVYWWLYSELKTVDQPIS